MTETKTAKFVPLKAGDVAKEYKTLAEFFGRFNRRLDRLLRSVVYYAFKDGNTAHATMLTELCDKFSKGGMRGNSMRRYLEARGPFTWDKENKKFKLDKVKRNNITTKYPTDEALCSYIAGLQSWFIDNPEAPYKPMDLVADITKLLGRAEGRVGSEKGDKVDVALLKKLQSVVEGHAASQAVH